MAVCFALALTACASTDDALLKTVPIGSGTSTLTTFEFIKCVKGKWTPIGPRVREYGLGADSQAVSIPGQGGSSTVLVVAQPAAYGTGYTIYGDSAAGSRYVAAAHACD
ncbi:hypothetical protein [Burkholderia sp. 8Y]|uniref:hypothetical protein n=1 Tax=Burkholderia sp. 8Y TaxID=2653133 RepID=UPI001F229113|nr:hypothetical protein [Burkholderia sp. 8Y]